MSLSILISLLTFQQSTHVLLLHNDHSKPPLEVNEVQIKIQAHHRTLT